MGKILNNLFKNLVKVRIQGPLNEQIQSKTISHLQSVYGRKTQALVVIINSYGGSLRVAQNISHYIKKIIRERQTPVYCFAEEFCLNSAALILTSGTRCYANKLSIIGDFGYVYQGYNWQKIGKHLDLGIQAISNNTVNLQTLPLERYSLTNQNFIKEWVCSNQETLIQLIIANRKQELNLKGVFDKQFMQKGIVKPIDALGCGLIDGLQSYDRFINDKYGSIRLSQQKQATQYSKIQIIRNVLGAFNND